MRRRFAAVTGAKRPQIETKIPACDKFFMSFWDFCPILDLLWHIFHVILRFLSFYDKFFMSFWDFCVTKKGLPCTLIRYISSWAHNLSSRLKIFNPYWLVARVGPRPWPERSDPLLKIFFTILFFYTNTFHFKIFLIVSENFIKVFSFPCQPWEIR